MKNKIIRCSLCGCRFSDSLFHVTTAAGHIYCEHCIFTAMIERRAIPWKDETGWNEDLEVER